MTAAPLLLAALLAAPSAPSNPALAVTSAEAGRARLSSLEGRMEAARRALRQKEEEERSLLGEMERLDQAAALSREEAGRLRRQEEELSRRVEQAVRRIGELAAEREAVGGRLRDRSVSLYKSGLSPAGQGRGAGLFWDGKAREDLDRRLYYLEASARHDAGLLEKVRQQKRREEAAAAELASRRDQLSSTRESLEERLRELARRRQDKQELLGGIREERSSQQALLGELEEAAARVLRLLEELARSAAPGSEFLLARGRLRPPVEGPLVEDFGRHRHPRLKTFIVSRGLTFKAAEGTPVEAVFRGKVLFADWFRGYGRIVILDHQGGFYTLYGHLATLAVAAGDTVADRQVIGAVGETGALEGPGLYFEVRRQGKPEDPKGWLVKQTKKR